MLDQEKQIVEATARMVEMERYRVAESSRKRLTDAEKRGEVEDGERKGDESLRVQKNQEFEL